MKNRKNLVTSIIIMVFVIMVMLSCTNYKAQTNVAANVSFSKDILPIFQINCAINSGCHVGSNNSNDHVDLRDSTAYNTIISRDLVNTANPEISLLYNEISSGTMPKAPYNPLPSSQINLVLSWIQQGAKNN